MALLRVAAGDAARDMDLLREVLGDAGISYHGLSCGTWLGAWYGSRFPDRVDRMILSGVLDLTKDLSNLFVLQSQGVQYVMDELHSPYAALHPGTYLLGGTADAVRGDDVLFVLLAARGFDVPSWVHLQDQLGALYPIQGGLFTASPCLYWGEPTVTRPSLANLIRAGPSSSPRPSSTRRRRSPAHARASWPFRRRASCRSTGAGTTGWRTDAGSPGD